ncbi:hypothetical protein D3C72_1733120 [compost metagenome]
MHVAVDQAGHHGLAGHVDHSGLRRVDGRGRDLDDPFTVDQDIMARQRRAACGVEDVAALEQDLSHEAVAERLPFNACEDRRAREPDACRRS